MTANQIKDNALQQTVQMLEAEGTFAEVVYEIFHRAESYLESTGVLLMQINAERTKVGTIVSWQSVEETQVFPGEFNISDFEVFGDELTVCYKGSVNPKHLALMNRIGAEALLIAPIVINDMVAMYMVVFDAGKEKHFTEEQIQFTDNVSKIIQDIAKKKIINNSLISSYELLREILSSIGTGIIVCSRKDGTVLFENDIARNVDEIRRTMKECVQTYFDQGDLDKAHPSIEHYDSESGLWFEVSFANLKWLDGSKVIICTAADITQKKKNQQKIEYQAHNDFLTGLYNRMKCETDLRKLIRRAVKDESKGAICFLDLDDFKHINDGLGHQYGDILLQQIAAGLQGVPGLRGHCYRMGGDEFVIIIEPEMYPEIEKIIIRIMALFNKPWYLMETEYFCTMSMGIAYFPEHDTDVNELVKKADIAMYEAKKSGKNQYAVYSNGNDKGSIRRLDIENNMRLAIAAECNEFVIFYQPVVNAQTAECTSCEALVRWNSKALGFLGPGEFIPLAEYLGLITSIGDYVLEEACKQSRIWYDAGHTDFRINVNLSVVQLLQKNIVENVRHILQMTGANANNIVIEITESFAINDMDRVMEIIRGLKKLGLTIALDDFGTGYSSLNYIKQLPLDIIKVDKTFIDDILEDEYAQAFVKVFVDLSKTIGTKICVEGVETQEQYELLKELGVDYIQGFYFSRPIPGNLFEQKFLKQGE